MHGDPAIAQNRLRARRRHHNEFGRALGPVSAAPRSAGAVPIGVADGIADIPQVTGVLLRLDFQVRDGRLAARAPVHHIRPAVDEAALVEGDEGHAHGAAQGRIEGEALAIPIAGDAELSVLIGNAGVHLPFPLPRLLDERGAAQVVAGQPLFGEFALHDILGGDAGVIRAGEIQGLIAAHPIVARHQILQRSGHRVAEVQNAGHVGGRHGDAETRAV
ncbi:MAG: hypothetical protein BWY25_02204 [Chloroflexi bacterium ADurb.Bin222]|nr:MAG: hypothetical protein BWY25_02204 [Chloroflexi bacterium ADurb.Bin222]